MEIPPKKPQHGVPKAMYNFKEAHSNVKHYIDRYNAKVEEPKNRASPPSRSKINSNERASADHLVRLCLKQLHQANHGNSLSNNEGPSLHTYTPSLAKLRGCSNKTIQNHRKKLKESGIIVKEEWHGKNGLRIWLNPELVYKTCVENIFQCTSQNGNLAEKTSTDSNKTKKLHPLQQDLQDQQDLENNIRNVDMLVKAITKGLSNPSTCERQYQNKTKEQDGPGKEIKASDQLKHTDKNSRKNKKGEEKKDSSQQWKRFCMDIVNEFWIHAKHRIFPNEKFAIQDLRAIKKLIWYNVFNGFPREFSENQYRENLRICIKRLTMAQKWIESHPSFITLPPHLYFGPEKKVGTFHQTLDWYIKSQIKRMWNQIYSEAKKFRAGKLHFIRKGVKYIPTVQEVYRRHIEILKEFGNQDLMDQLNKHTSKNLDFYLGYKPFKLKRKPLLKLILNI